MTFPIQEQRQDVTIKNERNSSPFQEGELVSAKAKADNPFDDPALIGNLVTTIEKNNNAPQLSPTKKQDMSCINHASSIHVTPKPKVEISNPIERSVANSSHVDSTGTSSRPLSSTGRHVPKPASDGVPTFTNQSVPSSSTQNVQITANIDETDNSKSTPETKIAASPSQDVHESSSVRNIHVFDPLLNNIQDCANDQKNHRRSATTEFPKNPFSMDTSKSSEHVIDSVELSRIAAELAALKPRKATEQEEAQLAQDDHVITLGNLPEESTGTHKSHRRVGSTMSKRSLIKNTNTSSTEETGGLSSSMRSVFHRAEKGNDAVSTTSDRPATPTRVKKKNSCSSPTRDKKKDKNVEKDIINTKKQPPLPMKSSSSREIPKSVKPKPQAKCINDDSSILLRSSELDPTPHQVQIPPESNFLLLARLCQLMDHYRRVDQNFDFSALIHMDRINMESMINRTRSNTATGSITGRSRSSSPAPETISSNFNTSNLVQSTSANASVASGYSTPTGLTPNVTTQPSLILPPPTEIMMEKGSNCSHPVSKFMNNQHVLMDAHMPILSSLIDCGDDVIVEGFYHEVGDDKNHPSYDTSAMEKPTRDRMEVVILKSEQNRQFLVVYQGSSEAQIKPVRNRDKRAAERARFGKSSTSKSQKMMVDGEEITIFSPFRKAYFSQRKELEDKVFKKLDELSEQHPFFDVIMTGHSFGAALATISSLRYASTRSMIMVSCMVFGCPKIGALNYRQYSHSLPNLKVMRVEYCLDPWVNAPDQANWVHAGHSIIINSDPGNVTYGDECSKRGRMRSMEAPKSNKMVTDTPGPVKAYRFGKNSPNCKGGEKTSGKTRRHYFYKKEVKQRSQHDNDIGTYVHAIERIQQLQLSWPKSYVGEVGEGVAGFF
eukprot:CAMPEP_0184860636 /NCGR_PEP_ID=MMETSP0580-20130426/5496_1 /TAXON_ID=1118495 /ORGANISM="Dactyliosolen fragilissimus" /LENGTH=890 /DNA_ID=CAMNT_0027357833 /DNA_START=310 /DNA_END=2979 /DNA_ORIENTATION=-